MAAGSILDASFFVVQSEGKIERSLYRSIEGFKGMKRPSIGP
jgi:hypothetical protein